MIILNSEPGNFIISGGRRYSYFAGNNYLGLACHPLVKEASINSIKKFGNSFSASRQTTGTSVIHLELEKELSEFKGRQDSVIFASGYLGNRILLERLKDRYSAVFMDEYAHPSIYEGIPREICNIYRYRHLDCDHLEELLQRNNQFRPLIITDGIFALTGEIAPLDMIYPLAVKNNAVLVVDDAHATGVLGNNGRGTPEYFNLDKATDIYQSETLSKALGSYGGFISNDKEQIDLIREKSPIYQASTSLPPSISAAGIASLKIIRENPGLSRRLLHLAGIIRKEIIALGFQTTTDNTQIIPVILPSPEVAAGFSAFLEENDIIVPAMNYPVMPESSMLRIAVSAIHTDDQVEKLLETMNKWKISYGKAYNQKNAH
jgi:7-keto-8-aminopelargonate synthetase-like enzyme